jgi:excinuclease ABC subunit A
MPEMTPRAFSFNSPHGACPDCQGLGATYDFDPRLIVPDESLSLLGGAIEVQDAVAIQFRIRAVRR